MIQLVHQVHLYSSFLRILQQMTIGHCPLASNGGRDDRKGTMECNTSVKYEVRGRQIRYKSIAVQNTAAPELARSKVLEYFNSNKKNEPL